VLLIYSVGVGGERHDLIMSNERGGNITRLTQNQGSNTYPACSPDGRLLAYFSVRNKESGLFIKSLKNWRSSKISSRVGESLRWDALPALPTVPAARPQPAATPAATPAVPAPAAPAPAPASPAAPAPR
jgi:TolB protein